MPPTPKVADNPDILGGGFWVGVRFEDFIKVNLQAHLF